VQADDWFGYFKSLLFLSQFPAGKGQQEVLKNYLIGLSVVLVLAESIYHCLMLKKSPVLALFQPYFRRIYFLLWLQFSLPCKDILVKSLFFKLKCLNI
jgi:hypothetical protein